MAVVRVAINGFGRIGRLAFRQMFGAKGYKVVAINDLTTPKMLAHLLKYDTAHRSYDHDVTYDENSITVVEGGQTRRESVRNALLATDADIVLIQDAARPFLKREYIDGCLDAMDRYPGATVAAPSTDTIKISREDQTVDHTTDRSRTWQTQTPQCFDRQVLLEANARYDGSIEATDDCMLLERTGFPVALIPGSAENIKITRPLDLKLAELLIADGRM